MSNILITGITGFTGFYLVEYLEEIKKNMNIIGIGRHAPNNEYNYEFIKCNLLNSDIIKDIVKAVKPDYVFHLAGLTRSNNLKLLYDVNVIGSINLLEALKAIKELVDPKILILGSSAEYGIVKENELPISENNHLRPITHYGVSKVSQDLLGYQYYANYGLKIIRVRPFNLIGSGQSTDFVCSAFAKQISKIEKRNSKPELFVGNLEPKRDFIDVRDAVKAYGKVLQTENYGEVYNIGSGRSYSIKKALDILLSMTNRNIVVKTDINKLKKSDVPNQVSDIRKIKREVGWEPEKSLEKSLKDMLDYERNRDKYEKC